MRRIGDIDPAPTKCTIVRLEPSDRQAVQLQERGHSKPISAHSNAFVDELDHPIELT